MSADQPHPGVTRLLNAAASGAAVPSSELQTLVYDQLRRIAQQRMAAERRDHTLQATALVHEAYLRLLGEQPLPWSSRAHFFFAAGRAMQQILVEHARADRRLKRGGGPDGERRRVPLNVVDLAAAADSDEILALDEAICRLETEQPEAAAVVRLKFFAGLSGDDAATALGVSSRQVDRLWRFARTWLHRRLENEGAFRRSDDDSDQSSTFLRSSPRRPNCRPASGRRFSTRPAAAICACGPRSIRCWRPRSAAASSWPAAR